MHLIYVLFKKLVSSSHDHNIHIQMYLCSTSEYFLFMVLISSVVKSILYYVNVSFQGRSSVRDGTFSYCEKARHIIEVNE